MRSDPAQARAGRVLKGRAPVSPVWVPVRARVLFLARVLLLVGVLLVAACGGSGGDEASPTTRLTVPEKETSTSSTSPTTTTAGSGDPNDPGAQPEAAAQSAPAVPSSAAPPSAVSGALAGKVVALDPGHNPGNAVHPSEINRQVDAGNRRKECDTTGTSTDAGYSEAHYTYDVALRLQALLEQQGARVVMTRSPATPWGPCITERAAIGNRAGAHAAVSIHADGGPPSGRGFHVIVPAAVPGLNEAIAGPSERLGRDILAAFAAGTGIPPADYVGTGGLSRRDDLGGLNLSTVPKVFIESGNMRNATDAALLSDPSFRQRIALALADGLTRFLTG